MKMKSHLILAAGCVMIGVAGGVFINELIPLQAQPQLKPAILIPKEMTSYRDIVKAVVPAVVSIESKVKQKRALRPNLGFRNGILEEIIPAQAAATEVQLGFGSGVIVDPKGVILTNYHVVEGADSVEVRLPDGRKFAAKEIRFDRKTDLAIVLVQADKPLPSLEFGDSAAMEVGDRVLAVGAPFGLTGSVTHGIISAKSRSLRLNQYEDFLQTDAAINPGNSGGPLISLDGKVIGLNSAIKSKSGGFQGVGLAISSNLAKSVVDKLLKDGSVKRGYLGVKIRDIEGDFAAKLGIKEGSGVYITSILDQSPAAKGGLKFGDILKSIAGKPVRDGLELQKVVAGLTLNQPVDMIISREGRAVQLKLTIEEQPEEFGDTQPKRN